MSGKGEDKDGTWLDPASGLRHWVVSSPVAGRPPYVYCSGEPRGLNPFEPITCVRCLYWWLKGRDSLDHIRGMRADLVIIDEVLDVAWYASLTTPARP